MKTFFTLTPKQSEGLDSEVYDNARDLWQDAHLIVAKNKSFSTATSLMVLSLEETIKAILIKLHSEGLKVYEIEDAKKFFNDHKIRHQIAQLIEIGHAFYESFEKWQSSESKNWFAKGFKILKIGAVILKANDNVKNLEKFNDYKNNGLYVGYRDILITPEKTVGTKEYYEVKELLERTVRFYKFLRILYHPKLKNHQSKKKVSEIRANLKLFIDEAMVSFSFKKLKVKK
ncbi:AbiV family abortive infection protein [Gillisia limnaea]|uniref:AbiV family abortive infection protein n=1 Tax=Gillisia limnaea (strain DSM 15749 / LMG 21470 / R-8282) TaxID=865937 RepID=H2BVR4_GILLR|nr:AbiV family abortive infection protein [Gillisia limnaea]EHQ04020.1 hypothetical protein Gilli_3420 [Gillisia limnaea DSM 15749]